MRICLNIVLFSLLLFVNACVMLQQKEKNTEELPSMVLSQQSLNKLVEEVRRAIENENGFRTILIQVPLKESSQQETFSFALVGLGKNFSEKNSPKVQLAWEIPSDNTASSVNKKKNKKEYDDMSEGELEAELQKVTKQLNKVGSEKSKSDLELRQQQITRFIHKKKDNKEFDQGLKKLEEQHTPPSNYPEEMPPIQEPDPRKQDIQKESESITSH